MGILPYDNTYLIINCLFSKHKKNNLCKTLKIETKSVTIIPLRLSYLYFFFNSFFSFPGVVSKLVNSLHFTFFYINLLVCTITI